MRTIITIKSKAWHWLDSLSGFYTVISKRHVQSILDTTDLVDQIFIDLLLLSLQAFLALPEPMRCFWRALPCLAWLHVFQMPPLLDGLDLLLELFFELLGDDELSDLFTFGLQVCFFFGFGGR